MAGLLHNFGARVKVFINTVTKAHQLDATVLVFDLSNKAGNIFFFANMGQHFQHGFIGATMGRPPQGGNPCGNAGKGVGPGGTRQTHGGGGGILLMVGMQDQNPVHGAGQNRVDLVGFGHAREHHGQKVFRVIQVIARINKGVTLSVFVGPCRNGGNFGNQAHGREFAVFGNGNVAGVRVEGRERANRTTQDGHGVSIAAEAVEEIADLLMEQRVVGQRGGKGVILRFVGQFTIEQEVDHLFVGCVFRQLGNGVATVQQNALIAIDKRDLAVARGRLAITGVEREHSQLCGQFTNIDNIRSKVARKYGHLGGFATDRNGSGGLLTLVLRHAHGVSFCIMGHGRGCGLLFECCLPFESKQKGSSR